MPNEKARRHRTRHAATGKYKKKDELPTPTQKTKVKNPELVYDVEFVTGSVRKIDPEKIIGATDETGILMFAMKFKGYDNWVLVPAKLANYACPQIVIQFYQERLKFYEEESDETNG